MGDATREYLARTAESVRSWPATVDQRNIVQFEAAKTMQDDPPQVESDSPNAGSQTSEANGADGEQPRAPTNSNESSDQKRKNPRIKEVPARTKKGPARTIIATTKRTAVLNAYGWRRFAG